MTVGTTVVDVYQYVTWVDDPAIAGTQNLKRLTVVVQYHSVPTDRAGDACSANRWCSPPATSRSARAAPPRTSSSTTTSSSSTTTTTTAGSCGTLRDRREQRRRRRVHRQHHRDDHDVARRAAAARSTPTSPTTAAPPGAPTSTTPRRPSRWPGPSPSGDGTKTISGRARSGTSGTPWSLPPQSIILDTTPPTTPASISRTASCSGSRRTVVLSWTASTDTYLVGYHVYVSSDSNTYSLQGSASGTDVHHHQQQEQCPSTTRSRPTTRPETNPVRLRSSSSASSSARRRGAGEAGVTIVELSITTRAADGGPTRRVQLVRHHLEVAGVPGRPQRR